MNVIQNESSNIIKGTIIKDDTIKPIVLSPCLQTLLENLWGPIYLKIQTLYNNQHIIQRIHPENMFSTSFHSFYCVGGRARESFHTNSSLLLYIPSKQAQQIQPSPRNQTGMYNPTYIKIKMEIKTIPE